MSSLEDIDARIDELTSELAAVREDPAHRQMVIDRYIGGLLGELGQATWFRYEEQPDPVTLDAAIARLDQARGMLPDDPMVAWWLATTLAERYFRTHDRTALDRAIDLYAEVADAPDGDPEDIAAARFRLASLLLDRGDALDRAIAELEAALPTFLDSDDPDQRTTAQDVAGRAYLERFRRDQRPDDAEQVIAHWGAYVDSSPDDLDPAILLNLAAVVHSRAAPLLVGGDRAVRADVERARELTERALAMVPPHDALRVRALVVAATVGWDTYQLSRRTDDLDLITRLIAEATTIGGHPDADVDPDLRDTLDTIRATTFAERTVRGLPTDPAEAATAQRVAQTRMRPDEIGSMLTGPITAELVAERRADLRRRYAATGADDPSRAIWAMAQVMLEMRAVDALRIEPDIPAMVRMLAEVERLAGDNAQLRKSAAAMRGMVGLLDAARGNNRQIPEALRLIEENRDLVEPGSDLDRLLDSVQLVVPQLVPGAQAAPAGPADADLGQRVYDAAMSARSAISSDDTVALRAAVDELGKMGGDATADPTGRRIAIGCYVPLRLLADPPLGSAEQGPRGRSVLLVMAALARFAAAMIVYQDAGTAEALRDAAETLRTLPIDDPESQDLRVHLAGAYMARIERFRTNADASIVITELEAVLPHLDRSRPSWSQAKSWLAEAYEIRGAAPQRQRPSVVVGSEGLDAYAWRVLLAPDTETASTAANGAVAEARTVVSRALEDKTVEPAIRALDGSRGLVLLAGTAARQVGGDLAAAGLDDLAAEWAEADAVVGGTIPADLRKRAMEALVESDRSSRAATRLLNPPSVTEIQTALGSAGADALIYLAPLESDNVPVAVVVPATGEPEFLRLSVVAAKFSALDAYLASPLSGRSARDAFGADEDDEEDDVEPVDSAMALTALADWAWHAAMREVMAWCARRKVTEPRLVLVPMAEFGLVPWHAARAPGGRYVLADATISYAVSARLFCENARRSPIPVGAGSLIVGNPTTDLLHAGAEAEAIHDVMYPDAPYFGRRSARPPDGAGTVEEVLTWLRGSLSEPRGLVHLACHGIVDRSGKATSFLRLYDHGQLAAEQLVELAQKEPGGYQIGTVVLAACSTGLSGRDYDEAFSLVSAFGMSGVRSVIGSLWKVPDDATSLLMYMFHHYLRTARLGSADALRKAQLWMIDDDRVPPPTMPESMRDRATDTGLALMVGWAGFTHSGQW